MSLRDALLAKGLVSKKDVRRTDQELRAERKQAQGAKRAASELAAEAEAKRKAEEDAAKLQRLVERKRREAQRDAEILQLRVRQIVRANAIRSRGKFKMFYRQLDGKTLGTMYIGDRVAWMLRCGEAAIAALLPAVVGGEPIGDIEYVVISPKAAVRLDEFAPDLLVHWVRDTTGLSAPEEAPFEPDWEISLKPHRKRDETP